MSKPAMTIEEYAYRQRNAEHAIDRKIDAWRHEPGYKAPGWVAPRTARRRWPMTWCRPSGRACCAWLTGISSGMRCGEKRQPPALTGVGLPTRCQALDQHLNSSFEGRQGERFHRAAERA